MPIKVMPKEALWIEIIKLTEKYPEFFVSNEEVAKEREENWKAFLSAYEARSGILNMNMFTYNCLTEWPLARMMFYVFTHEDVAGKDLFGMESDSITFFRYLHFEHITDWGKEFEYLGKLPKRVLSFAIEMLLKNYELQLQTKKAIESDSRCCDIIKVHNRIIQCFLRLDSLTDNQMKSLAEAIRFNTYYGEPYSLNHYDEIMIDPMVAPRAKKIINGAVVATIKEVENAEESKSFKRAYADSVKVILNKMEMVDSELVDELVECMLEMDEDLPFNLPRLLAILRKLGPVDPVAVRLAERAFCSKRFGMEEACPDTWKGLAETLPSLVKGTADKKVLREKESFEKWFVEYEGQVNQNEVKHQERMQKLLSRGWWYVKEMRKLEEKDNFPLLVESKGLETEMGWGQLCNVMTPRESVPDENIGIEIIRKLSVIYPGYFTKTKKELWGRLVKERKEEGGVLLDKEECYKSAPKSFMAWYLMFTLDRMIFFQFDHIFEDPDTRAHIVIDLLDDEKHDYSRLPQGAVPFIVDLIRAGYPISSSREKGESNHLAMAFNEVIFELLKLPSDCGIDEATKDELLGMVIWSKNCLDNEYGSIELDQYTLLINDTNMPNSIKEKADRVLREVIEREAIKRPVNGRYTPRDMLYNRYRNEAVEKPENNEGFAFGTEIFAEQIEFLIKYDTEFLLPISTMSSVVHRLIGKPEVMAKVIKVVADYYNSRNESIRLENDQIAQRLGESLVFIRSPGGLAAISGRYDVEIESAVGVFEKALREYAMKKAAKNRYREALIKSIQFFE